MVTIQGPITFQKGRQINREAREALKQSLGIKSISKEEAKKNMEMFEKGSKEE